MNATKLKAFSSGFASLFSGRGKSNPPLIAADAAGVVAEGLESRMLFAVSVVQDSIANTLTITADGTTTKIEVYQLNATPKDQIFVEINDATLYGAFNVDVDLTLIKVFGQSNGEDIRFGNLDYGFLTNSQFGEAVSVRAEVKGADGTDTIVGTDQADTLWGDGGADSLFGARGADTMYGGYGGSGTDNSNDTLQGDQGADSMFGEDGDDTFDSRINDAGATDYLDGGSGSDTAIERDSGDTLVSIEILS